MNEEMNERREQLESRAKQAFDESVAGLDGQTRSKLAQARARAVEASSKRGWFWLPSGSGLLPAGALAAGILAVAIVWQLPQTPDAPLPTAMADIDILLGEEELELFEELEFYAWLEEQPELQEAIDALDSPG